MSEFPVISHPEDVDLDEVIEKIASALSESRSPFILGTDVLPVQAQRLAMKLAMATKASIDSGYDSSGRGNMFALQKRGRVTATIGEIKQRSEMILCWFCDPLANDKETFDFLQHDNRRLIVVDETKTETARVANQFHQLSSDAATEAIWSIRTKLSGSDAHKDDWLEQLASELKSAEYGAMIWGNANQLPEFNVMADGIHCLIRDLNQHTRFVGIPYRSDGNSLGMENVSTWSSGFPFAVNLNRGHARHHWLEYSDEVACERREEWDCLLSFTDSTMEFAARENNQVEMFSVPCIPCRLGEAGEFCRLDDVVEYVEGSESGLSSFELLSQILAVFQAKQ